MRMHCATCGEESEFVLEEGRYSCTNCYTQSENWRQLEHEHEYEGRDLTRQVKPTVPVEEDKPREGPSAEDLGLPWSSWEAFTVILKHQTDAVVSLGAPESLRSVVRDLWFRYLQHSGVAFHGTAELRACAARHSYQRDKLYDVGKQPDSYNRCTDKPKRLLDDDDEDEDEDDESVQDAEVEKSAKKSRYAKADDESNWSTKNAKDRTTLLKVTCFVLVGLRLSHVPVFDCDFIRWIISGHVPFFNVTRVLPAGWKLNDQDRSMLSSSGKIRPLNVDAQHTTDASPVSVVRHMSAVIARTLHLTLPESDVQLLCSRMLVDLCLPRELHCVVATVVEKCPLPVRVVPEVQAASYIIASLYVLLGLTGEEVLLSDFAAVLQKKLSDEWGVQQQLFSFQQWVETVSQTRPDEFEVQVERACRYWRVRPEDWGQNVRKNTAMYARPDIIARMEKLFDSFKSPRHDPETETRSESDATEAAVFFPHRHYHANNSLTDFADHSLTYLISLERFCDDLRLVKPNIDITPEQISTMFADYKDTWIELYSHTTADDSSTDQHSEHVNLRRPKCFGDMKGDRKRHLDNVKLPLDTVSVFEISQVEQNWRGEPQTGAARTIWLDRMSPPLQWLVSFCSQLLMVNATNVAEHVNKIVTKLV